LKDNIIPLRDPEKKIKTIESVSFEWDSEHKKIKEHPAIVFKEAFTGTTFGFIAQDVEKIIPEVVDTDDEGYKSMHYGPLVSLGLANLKINQKRIDSIYERINKLTEIIR
jgi:hypothetical protein